MRGSAVPAGVPAVYVLAGFQTFTSSTIGADSVHRDVHRLTQTWLMAAL
jgi:hypothetical protein